MQQIFALYACQTHLNWNESFHQQRRNSAWVGANLIVPGFMDNDMCGKRHITPASSSVCVRSYFKYSFSYMTMWYKTVTTRSCVLHNGAHRLRRVTIWKICRLLEPSTSKRLNKCLHLTLNGQLHTNYRFQKKISYSCVLQRTCCTAKEFLKLPANWSINNQPLHCVTIAGNRLKALIWIYSNWQSRCQTQWQVLTSGL